VAAWREKKLASRNGATAQRTKKYFFWNYKNITWRRGVKKKLGSRNGATTQRTDKKSS